LVCQRMLPTSVHSVSHHSTGQRSDLLKRS